jgi:hypothetical protein
MIRVETSEDRQSEGTVGAMDEGRFGLLFAEIDSLKEDTGRHRHQIELITGQELPT